MKGYVVVFEGDDESGYSAYSPDLPGVIAAGDSRQETETLMIEAMAAHIAMLHQEGLPVPRTVRGRKRHDPRSGGCVNQSLGRVDSQDGFLTVKRRAVSARS